MFNKVEISIDTDESRKGIYFGSLFDVTYKNKKVDIDATITNASALDIANTIAAIHTGIDSYGQSEIKKQISQETFNAGTYYRYVSLGLSGSYGVATEYNKNTAYYTYDSTCDPVSDLFDGSRDLIVDIPPQTPALHAQLTAKNIGAAILNADMDAFITQVGISNLHLYQAVTLDLGSSDSDVIAKNAELKANLSNMITSTTGGYILISFEITTSELSYKSSLLPEHIYLTASLRNDNALDNVAIEYNNMTQREIAVLKALAGEAGSSFDTDTVALKMRTCLYGVPLFSYNSTDYTLGMVLALGTNTVNETLDSNDLIDGNYQIDITLS